MESKSWVEYFCELADLVATKSKDPSTKCGAVIVSPTNEILSTGFNGFPRGVDETDPSRWERPTKYSYVEHAERNAIYNAARNGIKLLGATLIVQNYPCTECTKAIIQAGISKVVILDKDRIYERSTWKDSVEFALSLLDEVGIEKVIIDYPSDREDKEKV